MIPLDRMLPELKSWFADATGLECRFRNESEETVKRYPYGIVQLRGVRDLHVDEARSSEQGGNLSYELVGNRVLNVEFSVRSRSQAPRDSAFMFTERARTQLRAPWAKDRLRLVGLAIVEVGDALVFDAPWQDRVESIATFEARFACAANLVDARSSAGTIAQVRMSSDKLNGADGEPLDEVLQVSEETVP